MKEKNGLLSAITIGAGVAIIVYFTVLVLMFIYQNPLKPLGEASNLTSLGQFGDFFGAINCLISVFTLFIIALTLSFQRKDLSDQKEQIIKNILRSEKHYKRQKLEELYVDVSKYSEFNDMALKLVEKLKNEFSKKDEYQNTVTQYEKIALSRTEYFHKISMLIRVYFVNLKEDFNKIEDAKYNLDRSYEMLPVFGENHFDDRTISDAAFSNDIGRISLLEKVEAMIKIISPNFEELENKKTAAKQKLD